MMTLNDAISSALGGQPITDGLAQYYLATGGSGSNLYDIERSWLVAKIGHDSGGTVNDLWREYLAVPPGGSLNDGLLLYWSGFSVANLFRNGEQGVWYDPSDFTTMSQDSAGTTPVTAVGQPVGLILDKSGRGNHATQSTATSRPVLQQDSGGRYYLAFDGTDDSLATASIDFGASDKVTIVAGIRRETATFGMLVELSSFPSAFYVASPGAGPRSTEFRSGGTIVPSSSNSARLTYAGVPTPDTHVLAAVADISGDLTRLRRNGVAGVDGVLDQGTGNFGNYPLYIGSRDNSSLPFNGRIYQLIIRGALTPNLSQIESYVNLKTGAY